MIQIHLNGLKMLPGIDYTATKNTIGFSTPPNAGDDILVTSAIPGGGAHLQRLKGDGFTFLYQLDSSFKERVQIQSVLADAWVYHNVPAVKDLLDRLQVVIELVKQDDPLHQR